jgi:hypothetical protein
MLLILSMYFFKFTRDADTASQVQMHVCGMASQLDNGTSLLSFAK